MITEAKISPLLSVCLITYNHCQFIEDAIKGVLNQNVNFNIELIIADDFSTDGTREILLKYQQEYPNLIKLILQKKNVGPAKNWLDLITYPQSKYIAYFEGDDYWTDPNKLQIQVDFLEQNPEYSFTFHNVNIVFHDTRGVNRIYHKIKLKEILFVDDLIKGVGIPSVSLVYRKSFFSIPDWILNVHNGDFALELILALNGPVKYFSQVMGVYRMQSTGLNSTTKNKYVHQQIIMLLSIINLYSNFKYNTIIQNKISEMLSNYKFSEMADLPTYKRIFSPLLWISKFKEVLENFISFIKIK